MNEGQKDLFGDLLAIPAVCLRTLQAAAAPDLIALVKIADGIARILRPQQDGAGVASAVDAARVLGGEFPNTARKFIAAAAGLRGDIDLSAVGAPSPAAVQQAERCWARFFLGRLDTVRAFLMRIEAEGK